MQPPITVSSLDAARLESLLASPAYRDDPQQLPLLDELARADIVDPQAMPPGVVTMHSTVRFAIDSRPEPFCLTLVYPKDMHELQEAISIMSPVGSALLGLSVGDTIAWPRPDGQLQQVRLLDVLYQPERAGDYCR